MALAPPLGPLGPIRTQIAMERDLHPSSVEGLMSDIRARAEERGFVVANMQAALDEVYSDPANRATQRTITISFQLGETIYPRMDTPSPKAPKPQKKKPVKRSRFDLIKD